MGTGQVHPFVCISSGASSQVRWIVLSFASRGPPCEGAFFLSSSVVSPEVVETTGCPRGEVTGEVTGEGTGVCVAWEVPRKVIRDRGEPNPPVVPPLPPADPKDWRFLGDPLMAFRAEA